MLEINKIHQGDCLELMKDIPDNSVDLILCDLPYGTTACSWDEIIPLKSIWVQYKRILKEQGTIVLTSSQPFSSKLVMSNPSYYSHSLIWQKEQGVNFLSSNNQPLKIHEEILIFRRNLDINKHIELRDYFYNEKINAKITNKQINKMLGYATNGSGMAGHYFKKDKEQFIIPREKDYLKLQKETNFFKKSYDEVLKKYKSENSKTFTYNPQKTKGKSYKTPQGHGSEVWGNKDKVIITDNKGTRLPISIIKFDRERGFHPTQKPIRLFEYLIKTYSNKGDLVLDNCMGSGTTAIACKQVGRNFIGIEKEEKYVEIAKKRIEEHSQQSTLIPLAKNSKEDGIPPTNELVGILPKRL